MYNNPDFTSTSPQCQCSYAFYLSNQNSLTIHSWDKANFIISWLEWPHPFLILPTLKSLKKLFTSNHQHVKVRHRIGWQSNQTFFHHYQYAKNIVSICSMHQIICDIHLILESHDLKDLPFFNHAHPVIIKVPFSFPKFASACKSQLISWVILEIQ